VLNPSQQRRKEMPWYNNDYRKDPRAHGYTVVSFHLESIRVSLFIFSPKDGSGKGTLFSINYDIVR